jgi:Spy/CpxP family protein refolding chaperone
MKARLAAALLMLALVGAQGAYAQQPAIDVTDMQALKAAATSDKRGLVASTLDLSPAEAKKFWPLYDVYQRKLNSANKRRSAALEGTVALDKPASNLFAKKLADELIAADEDELRARRTLHNAVVKVLPAKKATRYMQLEGKIRSLQAYEVASAFPLVK